MMVLDMNCAILVWSSHCLGLKACAFLAFFEHITFKCYGLTSLDAYHMLNCIHIHVLC